MRCCCCRRCDDNDDDDDDVDVDELMVVDAHSSIDFPLIKCCPVAINTSMYCSNESAP